MRLTVLGATSARPLCAPWGFCVQRDKCLALRDIEKWVRMMKVDSGEQRYLRVCICLWGFPSLSCFLPQWI